MDKSIHLGGVFLYLLIINLFHSVVAVQTSPFNQNQILPTNLFRGKHLLNIASGVLQIHSDFKSIRLILFRH